MQRLISPFIQKDLSRKIVLMTGPRQCGKTTLARMLGDSYDYLNYDNADHRLLFIRKQWDRDKDLLILDELHKMKKWKSWLKGVYDTEGLKPHLLVTGSSRLDTYKKVGDSLAGRYFQYRLHPLDVKEAVAMRVSVNANEALDRILSVGGFPEPYLEGDRGYYNRWKKGHLDIILKQDLIELENIQSIVQVETLIQLLKRSVGSPVSYSSLSEDLQCSDKTVKRYLRLLENMYVIFRLTPYHKNIARSHLKQPKFYFYDTGQVEGDDGARLENIVACALLKEIHYQSDCHGREFQIFYLRNKEKQEVDFFLTKEGKPFMLMEVKWAEGTIEKSLAGFSKFFPESIPKIQLVKNLKREYSLPNNIKAKEASAWLGNLDLAS